MEHKGTVTLETERLILRRFQLEDAQAMYRNWAADDEVTKFLTWPTHRDAGVSEKILSEWIGQYDQPDYYNWAIVWKETSEPIGNISVVSMNEKAELAQMGHCISRKWWHQRITSEALEAVIRFLFEEVQVGCVSARHDSRNVNSGKVMEKCGMKYEGTLRHSDWNNQGICDASYYSILREEYETRKKEAG